MDFHAIAGQAAAKTLLRRLIARQRFPAAMLFDGRRGTGRFSLACAAARALLCDRSQDGAACGVCDQCRTAAGGAHPDLVILPRRRPCAVETIREEVVEQAGLSPLQAQRRIFLLPDLDLYQAQSANALLKILEEPPSGTHLLMTKMPGRTVLPTILSRAQVLRVAALRQEDVVLILRRQGLDPEEAARRARLASGSHAGLEDSLAGDACPLAELLGLLDNAFDQGLIAEVLARLPRQSPDEDLTDAAYQRQLCRLWLDLVLAELRQRLRRSGSQRLLDQIEAVLTARGDLRLNLSPRAVLERLALAG